jgi:hypothetical protein
MMDLHSNIKVSPAINPGAILTDGTSTGATIDTKDYGSLEFVVVSGALTDGTFTCSLWESDDSGMSGETEVTASASLLGSAIVLAGATAAHDNATNRIGYRGNKRYVRIKVVRASTSTGGYLCAIAVQGHPRIAPVA